MESTQVASVAAVITGSGLLILCFGWCLLFIYFNSCGARRIYQEISKIVYQKDDTTQYESPVLPSKGIREEVYGESLDASDTKFVDLKQKWVAKYCYLNVILSTAMEQFEKSRIYLLMMS